MPKKGDEQLKKDATPRQTVLHSSASAGAGGPGGRAPPGGERRGAPRQFQPGAKVAYFSSTNGGWIEATVERVHSDGSVALDVHPRADPSRVRHVDVLLNAAGAAAARVEENPLAGAAATTGRIALPAGWSERYSQQHQRPYYCNAATGESSWTRPGGVDATRGKGHSTTVLESSLEAAVASTSSRDAQVFILVEYYSRHDQSKSLEQIERIIDELCVDGAKCLGPAVWAALSASMDARHGEQLPPLPVALATDARVHRVLDMQADADMDRGGGTQQYVCVRYATVRSQPSLTSAPLYNLKPGSRVDVIGGFHLDGHHRARIASRAEWASPSDARAEWVSLSTGKHVLFEPVECRGCSCCSRGQYYRCTGGNCCSYNTCRCCCLCCLTPAVGAFASHEILGSSGLAVWICCLLGGGLGWPWL